MLSRSASQRGTKLPQMSRRQSGISDRPPADSLKPDEEAIDDVYTQVEETGTLEAAAKRLAELAAAEAESGESPAIMARRATQSQAWMDDPEEAEYFAQYARAAAQYEEEEEEEVVEHMNEVIDGLWIGDLVAAMDADGMRERGISNVVSLLRPRLQFASDLTCYTIEIDDAPETDILTHLPSAVAWITEALHRRAGFPPEDGRPGIRPGVPETQSGGVLVHCQAGMSRSATVVAAFLMRELRLDPVEAITFLRERRPVVDPSETFWHQLGLYYLADGKVTLKDRSTRQWYLERTTGQVMNEGGAPSLEHMAKYPSTPTPSQPATPAGGHGRRKVRCKMCRQHLALREHMMDHILDQAPLSRPRTPSNFSLPGPLAGLSSLTPADEGAIEEDDDDSARPPRPTDKLSRRPSVASDIINPLTGLPASRSRRASQSESGFGTPQRTRSRSLLGQGLEGLSMTRASSHGEEDSPAKESQATKEEKGDESPKKGQAVTRAGRPILDADQLAARLPPQLAALRAGLGGSNSNNASPASSTAPSPPSGGPGDVPATRRRASSNLQFTPAMPNPAIGGLGGGGPPILVNPKCSGYFVEPLTWMEPVLANGDVAGKLVCPNPKCGAKIGNYDWAGVQCGCKEWVTPGFCMSRSKVEEVW